MSMAVVGFSSAARGRDAVSAETRRRLIILRGEFWASAGGRRGPKLAQMLLSLSATINSELEFGDGRCGAPGGL